MALWEGERRGGDGENMEQGQPDPGRAAERVLDPPNPKDSVP